MLNDVLSTLEVFKSQLVIYLIYLLFLTAQLLFVQLLYKH